MLGQLLGVIRGGTSLENLPTFTRSASSLMFYQPAISPDGMISGARREQVTFTFDGGDVTSDLEGSNSYAAPPGEPSPSPIWLGVDFQRMAGGSATKSTHTPPPPRPVSA